MNRLRTFLPRALRKTAVPSPGSSSEYFDASPVGNAFRGKIARGGRTTAVGQIGTVAISLASVSVLARLLHPESFGLIAMVSAFSGLLTLMQDFGLSTATIQRSKITPAQISTVFWCNIAIGIGCWAILTCLTPLISLFYGEPRLIPISLAIAPFFIVSGMGVQHRALLSRQLNFGALTTVSIASQLAGLVAAIVCATSSLGYWALVAQVAVTATSSTLLLWIWCPWRPSFPRRNTGVREMLYFGRDMTLANYSAYLARNVDNILIGRFWGAPVLGVYTRAYALMMFPFSRVFSAAGSVAVPALSRLQEQPNEFKHVYLTILQSISAVTMPIVIVMSVYSTEIVHVVLGPNWSNAAPLLCVLALSMYFQPITSSTGWIYVSLGQGARMLRWSFVWSTAQIIAFAVGVTWGALGVSIAYAACVYLIAWPMLAVAYANSPVTVAQALRAVRPCVVTSLTVAIVALLARNAFSTYDEIYRLGLGLAASVLTWAALAIYFKDFRGIVTKTAGAFWRGGSPVRNAR